MTKPTTDRRGRAAARRAAAERADDRRPSAPGRRRRPAFAALGAGVLLAYASSAGAQPASPAPPLEPLPGLGAPAAAGPLRFSLTPKFLTGVPTGAFGSRIGTTPGGALDFTARVGRTPVWVGAAFDYLTYGKETRRIALSPAVPEVLSDVDTGNNLFRTHALVRLQPAVGRVRPYAEGLLGFGYLYTRTSVKVDDDLDERGTTHLGDFAPSFGAGAGVTAEFASTHNARFALDIGLRYLTTAEVDYLTRGDLQRHENGVAFQPTRSPAALFAVQTGVRIDF